MSAATSTPAPRVAGPLTPLWPFLLLLGIGLALPLSGNDYWGLIATRMAVYWVLVAGLNLIVGYAGQLAIGYVALLTIGAYTTSVLAAGNVLPPVPTFAALGVAGAVGAIFGVVVGLPALRLRTFYFAMTTLGFDLVPGRHPIIPVMLEDAGRASRVADALLADERELGYRVYGHRTGYNKLGLPEEVEEPA